MEHVRTRNNNSSPRPPENLTAPLIQPDPSILTPDGREFDAEDLAWPSPPPSTTNVQYTDKSHFSSLRSLHSKIKHASFRFEPPRSLFRGFERPCFSRIVILIILCPTAYPAFYLLTLVAKDKSLFVVRLMVSTWCSAIGFVLGYILLQIGAQHLEAASEFMLVGYRLGFLKLHPTQPGPP